MEDADLGACRKVLTQLEAAGDDETERAQRLAGAQDRFAATVASQHAVRRGEELLDGLRRDVAEQYAARQDAGNSVDGPVLFGRPYLEIQTPRNPLFTMVVSPNRRRRLWTRTF